MNLELSNTPTELKTTVSDGRSINKDLSIAVRQVGQGATLKEFINVPWVLHSNDPVWVPPLRLAVEQSLDTKKNPFYKHAKIVLWFANRRIRNSSLYNDDSESRLLS